MRVKADVTQLENEGLYYNIIDAPYSWLGVMTHHYKILQCIYRDKERKHLTYCMLFKHEKMRKEFEEKYPMLECIVEFNEEGDIKKTTYKDNTMLCIRCREEFNFNKDKIVEYIDCEVGESPIDFVVCPICGKKQKADYNYFSKE